MATQVITGTQTEQPAGIKSDLETLYRVVFVASTNEKGEAVNDSDVVNEKGGEKIEKEGLYNGKEVISLEKQSFLQPYASDDKGWAYLIPDEGERSAMTGRGASTKLSNKARKYMKDVDENGDWANAVQETPIDQTEELKTISKSRQTASEKFLETIASGGVTRETLEKAMALLQKRMQESAVSA